MMDNSYILKRTNRLEDLGTDETVKFDGGKLFNLCLNLYTGFPLLDKPRNYFDSLVGENAQAILICGNKFIHPENYDSIPIDSVIDTVKHSPTGIFCQQIKSNRLENRSKKTLCAASLGLNKNSKNIAAAVLFDLFYGDSATQKEFHYDILSTLRELYTDLSNSRAVTNFLSDTVSYRYLVNYETGGLIAKRLPTGRLPIGTGDNNDNLAESIFQQIQHGHITEENNTAFDNQIKNLKMTRFRLSRFEYLLFSFEIPPDNNQGKELEFKRLFRCFAHRIKNKLGSLQTASSQLTLQSGNIIDDDDIALAEIIRSETESIDQLIIRTSQLMELEDPEFNQFDVLQSIKAVLADNQKKFDQIAEASIQSDSDTCFIIGDSNLFKIALDEIIQNGFEAGESITVEIKTLDKISITIKNRLTDQMYATLGNKTLDITEPYISLKPKKTGLGLSIASKIISLHDGTMNTNIDKNEGMIVEIILPCLSPSSQTLTPSAWRNQ